MNKLKTSQFANKNHFFKFFLLPVIQFLLNLNSNVKCNGIKFIVEPQDTIVSIGGSGILNCAAKGFPSSNLPKISWKKDGSLISFVGDTRSEEDESYFQRSILANGSLHITSLYRTREARPDEGLYQCFVTLDGVGSILSRFAKLQAASLSRFDEEPEDVTVGIGQTARFSCSAQGIPPPSVSWFKNNHPLTIEQSRMIVLPSGSLEIGKIQSSDEGNYHCNISNVDKHAVSRQGRLSLSRQQSENIPSPPAFTAIPKSQVAITSQSVVLECSAVGFPIPTITWLKNGRRIDFEKLGNRYSIVGEGNLAISNIEESDKGTIVCRAENHEDSSDVSANLDVHVPPRVLSTSSNFYAYEKEDVELPCKIYGKPSPVIQWYKNGDMIIEGDYFQIVNGNNLKILGCLSSDTAMYQCFGTNPSGNVQVSMHLRVLRKGEKMPIQKFEDAEILTGEVLPTNGGIGSNANSSSQSAPRDLVALLVSTRFVTLSWKPGIYPRQISGYAVYYKESGSDRERMVNTSHAEVEEVNIQGLQPNKRYTFRVVPYDTTSLGQSSKEITVVTQPEMDVPGPPKFLKAWVVSPSRVDLRWAPPDTTHGKIERYKVYYAEASENGIDSEAQFSAEEMKGLIEADEDEDDYLFPRNGIVQTMYVNSPEATLEDLRVFTEYFIWVVALNSNGPGTNSEQVRVTTMSDSPTDTPHNVSVEPASSTSVVVRWNPPPREFRNGIITGYKVKYKQKGRKGTETLTTDGNSHFLAVNDLERGTEYQIKIAALNINGTGPFTDWVYVTTFPKDLDESNVPDKPTSLLARPGVNSITINWTPPLNANVMVRGYTIGWGKGIPDVYTKVVDGKKRTFTIEKLTANNEYVISLRASNQMGLGIPIYENVRTKDSMDEFEEEQLVITRIPQLATPTGLRAVIISPTSAVLSWSDTSLPRNQINHRRLYTVRYTPVDSNGIPKVKSSYKYQNSSQLNTIINNLKPLTTYEFSVKVIKGRYGSEWSLVVMNRTLGVSTQSPILTPSMIPDFGLPLPTSPFSGGTGSHLIPQDLTLLAITGEDDSSVVILNWQPPKFVRTDDLRGYVIYYTTNPQRKEWVEEIVREDVLSHRISNLTPDTKYYFRMSARLIKGSGPLTDVKSVKTPDMMIRSKEKLTPMKPQVFDSSNIKINQLILYVLIGLSTLFALGSVFLCIYYRKKSATTTEKESTLTKKGKKQSNEVKPPDLWIHHDQMELKGIEKGRHIASTPLTPGSMEFGDLEEKVPLQNTNSLERGGYLSSYTENTYHSYSLGRRKPKPIKIPTHPFSLKRESTTDRTGGVIGPLPPPPQILDGMNKVYDSFQSGSSTTSSQQNINSGVGCGGIYSATSDYATQSGSSSHGGTLGRRSNLRSFTVPIPPPNIASSCQQQPQNNLGTSLGPKIIRPVGSNSHHPIPGGSPVKRISGTSQIPMTSSLYVGGGASTSGSMKSMNSPATGFPPYGNNSGMIGDEGSSLQKAYSTEDLSQEISNLEGLMKDLNAITANEFQC